MILIITLFTGFIYESRLYTNQLELSVDFPYEITHEYMFL